jgi:uncharacterized integral membrane protein (TIGR00698 family)
VQPVSIERRSGTSALSRCVPGLVLSTVVALSAFAVRDALGSASLNAMMIAFTFGIALASLVGMPDAALEGVQFACKNLLRIGVALLGLQLTLHELIHLGPVTFLLVFSVSTATFLFTVSLGRLIAVDRKLTELLAAGTAICGAAAIIATNAVTKADDRDVGYAITCISLFGTVAMVSLPLLIGPFHFSPETYGVWVGTSVHEVAQVVAASIQVDQISEEIAITVKLARVALLAPLILTLGLIRRRTDQAPPGEVSSKPSLLPWFLVAFVILVIVNSVVPHPAILNAAANRITAFILTVSLAAIGLGTRFSDIRSKGVRPIVLCATASCFIAVLSLALIRLTEHLGAMP